jgi:hypothetical protein
VNRLSKGNPTGVDSFDHTHVMHLEEYQMALQSLNELVQAMNNDDSGVGQKDWLEMVKRMTAMLPYSDSSGHNSFRDGTPYDCPWKGKLLMWWPVQVIYSDKGSLECRYHCPKCGHIWRSWFATQYATLGL